MLRRNVWASFGNPSPVAIRFDLLRMSNTEQGMSNREVHVGFVADFLIRRSTVELVFSPEISTQ